jgi:pimeloyl-ACP methyl ester carboxylesterase
MKTLLLLTIAMLALEPTFQAHNIRRLLNPFPPTDAFFQWGQCTPSEFTKSIPDNGKYQFNNYTVTTADGYILQMFRLRLTATELAKLSPSLQANAKRPMLIQHGLFDDSTSMIVNEQNSFGWYLIQKGFDVWFGNNRGSKFSTRHINDNLSHKDFYNYSFQEMALYDIPAFYNEILSDYPGIPDQQIIYLGHSEGTSQMFAALADPSTKAFIRKHTERFMALAPIVYMTNITEIALEVLPLFENTIHHLANDLGIYQIGSVNCDFLNPDWEKAQNWSCKDTGFLCHRSDLWPDNWKMKGAQGPDFSNDGASLGQLIHYGQLINGGHGKDPIFRKYDLGSVEANIEAYGASTPPDWLLDDWTTPLNLIAFGEDDLGTQGNVDILRAKLGKVMDSEDIIPGWGHGTCNNPPDPTPMFEILDRVFGR